MNGPIPPFLLSALPVHEAAEAGWVGWRVKSEVGHGMNGF